MFCTTRPSIKISPGPAQNRLSCRPLRAWFQEPHRLSVPMQRAPGTLAARPQRQARPRLTFPCSLNIPQLRNAPQRAAAFPQHTPRFLKHVFFSTKLEKHRILEHTQKQPRFLNNFFSFSAPQSPDASFRQKTGRRFRQGAFHASEHLFRARPAAPGTGVRPRHAGLSRAGRRRAARNLQRGRDGRPHGSRRQLCLHHRRFRRSAQRHQLRFRSDRTFRAQSAALPARFPLFRTRRLSAQPHAIRLRFHVRRAFPHAGPAGHGALLPAGTPFRGRGHQLPHRQTGIF